MQQFHIAVSACQLHRSIDIWVAQQRQPARRTLVVLCSLELFYNYPARLSWGLCGTTATDGSMLAIIAPFFPACVRLFYRPLKKPINY